jgi:hypothetical protein
VNVCLNLRLKEFSYQNKFYEIQFQERKREVANPVSYPVDLFTHLSCLLCCWPQGKSHGDKYNPDKLIKRFGVFPLGSR